jgi:hypothetical protein
VRTEIVAGVAFCVASLISSMARGYDAVVKKETFNLAGDFPTLRLFIHSKSDLLMLPDFSRKACSFMKGQRRGHT